jgi:hypothetical protein
MGAAGEHSPDDRCCTCLHSMQLGRASDQRRSLTKAVGYAVTGIESGHGTTAGTDTTAGKGSLHTGKQTDVTTAGKLLCMR